MAESRGRCPPPPSRTVRRNRQNGSTSSPPSESFMSLIAVEPTGSAGSTATDASGGSRRPVAQSSMMPGVSGTPVFPSVADNGLFPARDIMAARSLTICRSEPSSLCPPLASGAPSRTSGCSGWIRPVAPPYSVSGTSCPGSSPMNSIGLLLTRITLLSASPRPVRTRRQAYAPHSPHYTAPYPDLRHTRPSLARGEDRTHSYLRP